MSTHEEITGTFVEERFRFPGDGDNSDTIIGSIRVPDSPDYLTIKGPADADELRYGVAYRFHGRWTNYTNKRTGKTEKQFTFNSFVMPTPHTREGIIRYLQHAPNIGTARASMLWEEFGGDAVKVLREQPELAVEKVRARGFKVEHAKAAAEFLKHEAALEDCMIGLIGLLDGRGGPKTTAKWAVKKWGAKAPALISRNPYLLMNYRGWGWKKTDAMYLDLKLPPSKLKRQALCGWYAVARDTEGHTWMPIEVAFAGIKSNVAGAELRIEEAVRLGCRHGMITVCERGGRRWVSEGKKAKSEAIVAELVAKAEGEETLWPGTVWIGGKTSEHQTSQLIEATRGIIGILGGSPGTGKTYSAAELIEGLIGAYGAESVAVAAPTGKASVRITESLVAYGLSLKARTIHSLLGVAAREDGSGWSFTHNETNPLPFKFIVVDESSMIDADLMASLLRARAVGTHILFVGDVNQLPPVGHGAPLRDLIAAGVPYGELREIRRNSGRIVEVCAAIRDRQRWSTSPAIDIKNGENLFCVPAASPASQIEAMLEQLQTAHRNGLDPIWDCQVLVPVNKKSALARQELNRVLQDALNPSPAVGGSPFRPKDKIVNTKNGFFELDENYPIGEDVVSVDGKVFVANGELAEVLAVEEKLTVARLSSPTRVVKIPRGATKQSKDDDKKDDDNGGSGDENASESTDTGCSWDLGFALSVHKSQGSEWPIALVMLDEYPGARRVCSREWIYTAISRAKKLCLLIGKKATADGFCKRQALNLRKTFLAELIRENRTRLAVERETAEWMAAIGNLDMGNVVVDESSPLRIFTGDESDGSDSDSDESNSGESDGDEGSLHQDTAYGNATANRNASTAAAR